MENCYSKGLFQICASEVLKSCWGNSCNVRQGCEGFTYKWILYSSFLFFFPPSESTFTTFGLVFWGFFWFFAWRRLHCVEFHRSNQQILSVFADGEIDSPCNINEIASAFFLSGVIRSLFPTALSSEARAADTLPHVPAKRFSSVGTSLVCLLISPPSCRIEPLKSNARNLCWFETKLIVYSTLSYSNECPYESRHVPRLLESVSEEVRRQ